MLRYCLTLSLSLLTIIIVKPNITYALAKPTPEFKVDKRVTDMVLYLPIADEAIKQIPIVESNEQLVDLEDVNNPRIKALYHIDPNKYKKPYEHCSKIRETVYKKLIAMLGFLPKNIGIAFQEALRPISVQKKYFDAKFIEFYLKTGDPQFSFLEASKYVSPYFNNTPTHCTGAAIDMTLFIINNNGSLELLNMGEFDVVNDKKQEETFADNVTEQQKQNRMLLLTAATKAGLVNYGYEWWHFSYGDKAWAYVTNSKNAIYNIV